MKKLLPGWKAAPLGVKILMVLLSPVILVCFAVFAVLASPCLIIGWIQQIIRGEEPSDGGRGL